MKKRRTKREGGWRALWVVTERELRETAWRKRTFVTRALAALLLGVIFCLMASQLGAIGMARRYLLYYISVFLMVFLAAVLPILTGDVVAVERERGTLGLLFLTPLKPVGIVLGKAAGRMMLLISLVVACSPVIALSFLFGGVEAVEIVRIFLAAFFTLLWGLTFCLWMSARSATVMGAMISSYVWGIVVLFVLPILLAIAGAEGMAGNDFPLFIAWHPMALWVSALIGPMGGGGLDEVWFLVSIGGNFLIALLWFALAVERVRRFAEDPGLLQPGRAKGVSPRADAERKRGKAVVRWKRSSGGRLEGWIDRLRDHPEIWLELRHAMELIRRLRRGRRIPVVLLCVFAVLMLLPDVAEGYEWHFFRLSLSYILGFTVLLTSVVLAAGGMAREVESGRMDLLLTTTIRPRRWLIAKASLAFLGVLVAFLLLTFVVSLHSSVELEPDMDNWYEYWSYLVGPWLLLMGVAFWASSLMKRERSAFELTFGVACLVAVLWGFLMEWALGFFHYLRAVTWVDLLLTALILGGGGGLFFFGLALIRTDRLRRG